MFNNNNNSSLYYDYYYSDNKYNRMTNRRTSLPALRVSSPRTLSPKYYGYLDEISEFDVEPPFISPSSSSSAENSPRMLSPTYQRPLSARPFRRRRNLTKTYNIDEDPFDSTDNIEKSEYNSSNSSINNDVFTSTTTSSTVKNNFNFDKDKILQQQQGQGEGEEGENIKNQQRKHQEQQQRKNQRLTKMQQMRSFNIDCSGKIVDCGFRYGGIISKPLTPRTPKNRRATCPEIWLSCETERKDAIKFILRIYGIENSGKSTLIKQIKNHSDINGYSDEQIINDIDGQQSSNMSINFMMNDQEIELELIHGSALEKEPFQDIPTIYMVVYSVDNRESFTRSAQILYRLFNRKFKKLPLILVGNKIDLQRKRKISTIEGKMLAKIYKCSFVEISSLMGMNMENIWKEMIKKIQNQIIEKEKQDEKLQKRSENKSKLTTRIVESGRRFAKSCEELFNRIIEM